MQDSHPIKIKESVIKYQTPWMKVTEHSVTFPDGQDGIYSVLQGKDGVLIVAEDDDGKIYIMKEYRFPVRRWVWQFPSGGMEKGETPLQTAQKELREELGLTADEWIDVGSFSPSYGGGMNDRQYIFVARGLRQGTTDREGSEAIGNVRKISLDELWDMTSRGEFEDGQTLAGLLRYKLWLERN